MKKFLLFTLMLCVVAFAGCKKDDDGTTPANNDPGVKPASPFQGETLALVQSLSKRWNVTSETGKTATGTYLFFEFNQWGTFVVAFTDGSVGTGTFTVSNNNTTLTLPGVGVFVLTNSATNQITFTFTPDGSTTPIVIEAAAANLVASSTNTDMLCGSWRIDKVYYQGQLLTDYTGQVVFTPFGTYLSSIMQQGISIVDLRPWKWSDANENRICYNTDIQMQPDCVNLKAHITSLSNTNLVIQQVDSASGQVLIRYELSAQ